MQKPKTIPWGFLTALAVGLSLLALFQEPLFGAKTGGPAQGGSAMEVVNWTDTIGAKTATFQTTDYDLYASTRLTAVLEATAVTGTNPTCDCVIETSTDNVNWFTTGTAFTQLTTTGSEMKTIQSDVLLRFARLNCTLTGTTPSFTLNAYIMGHVQ